MQKNFGSEVFYRPRREAGAIDSGLKLELNVERKSWGIQMNAVAQCFDVSLLTCSDMSVECQR